MLYRILCALHGQYAWATIKHKYYVYLAGRRLGVGWWQLVIHDWTKFTPAEYPHYQRQFFGDKGDPVGFARAWLHHQNHWPHHWEYWITRTNHAQGAQAGIVDDCLPMPEIYVREMLADWQGASRAYTGSWDIGDWLSKNWPRIRLHPDTRRLLLKILADGGTGFAG